MSLHLPQVTIQHDFQTVISEVQEGIVSEEPFWISCYKTDHDPVHAQVNVQRDNHNGVNLIPDLSGVELQRGEHSMYIVACPKLSIPPTRLRVPRQVVGDRSQSRYAINAFDISPDSSLCATGDDQGDIRIYSSFDSSAPHRRANPHLSSILSLRFFPSSKVILTSSNDFTLSVISAENLTIPRKFKAHTRAVTDTAIISRGKNFLSCAKDGTVRLWDVGSGSQIRVMNSKSSSPVYKMCLGDRITESVIHQPPDGEVMEGIQTLLDPREVETSEKVVYIALQNGSFEAFDLGSKLSIFNSEPPPKASPLESIAYSAPAHMVATGSRIGVVTIHDTRQLATPLFSFQRNGTSVGDMTFISMEGEVRLAIATTDGLPYITSVRPDGPQVVEELVGYGDAVRAIRVVGESIWTAGDDALVRRY